MDDKVYVTELLDSYRSLLTEKQADIMSLYYEEDLSLSEITGHYNITRQAVLDNIKRSVRQLMNYEQKLHLVAESARQAEIISNIKVLCNDIHDSSISKKIVDEVLKLED